MLSLHLPSISCYEKRVEEMSDVEKMRMEYSPILPSCIAEPARTEFDIADSTLESSKEGKHLSEELKHIFRNPLVLMRRGEPTPRRALKIGVVFCGRQCPGAENIVIGLFDCLKKMNAESSLVGFIGGTHGLFTNNFRVLDLDTLYPYRNQGGLDLLGRTSESIETVEQQEAARVSCNSLGLDGLVLIGGAYTLTDGSYLSNYFEETECKTRVVCIPATIDGDIPHQFIETSVGFDTTCKVFSHMIGNIESDALSAKKYYYFIRLMGRAYSHIALDCALSTHANIVLLREEIEAKKMSLMDVIHSLADSICERAKLGKNYGLIVIPEGLVSGISEFKTLISEINSLFIEGIKSREDVISRLTPWTKTLFNYLPLFIQQQLLLDRDIHGDVQLSQISVEKMLAEMLADELKLRKKKSLYNQSFASISHFFGYHARCALPSNFDCTLANSLGAAAALLVDCGYTGYMPSVRTMKKPFAEWEMGGVPLAAMMRTSESGKLETLSDPIDLSGPQFEEFAKNRAVWMKEDLYVNPGPIQFAGPFADGYVETIRLRECEYIEKVASVRKMLQSIGNSCRLGCSSPVLNATYLSLKSLTQIIDLIGKNEA